jgi:phenylacetate-CoA ligase
MHTIISQGRQPRTRVRDVGGVCLAHDLDLLSRDEIDSLQQQNVATCVAAALRAPAVRRRFPGLTAVDTASDLASLPLLSPADLAAGGPPYSAEFLFAPDTAGLALRSSGTASRPKVVYHSWHSNDRVQFLGVRGLRSLQERPRRIANCMLAGEFAGAFLFVQDVGQALGTLVFPLGGRIAPPDVIEIIAAHEIDTLVATPAYGVELVTTATTRQLRSLRHLLYLGEAMGAERERAMTARLRGLRVRSLSYSTSETGPVGYQCRKQRGATHHVHEDAHVLDVVDENGRSVPPGTPGEIAVTPLTTSGMALFRYRLGDRGYVSADPCACGSAVRSVVLLGRTAQSMTVDGTTVSSDQLLRRLANFGVSDPADCQLQVLWKGHTFDVRLLLSTQTPENISLEAVESVLGESPQLHRIVTSRRCASVTVARTPRERFARTPQGKVPVLYQRLGEIDV